VTANPMSLEGRTILVTGAGQGIGKATAELVVKLGGRVVVCDINEANVRATADGLGTAAKAYVGSVADPKFVQGMVDDAEATFGPLDGLMNNAGIVRAAMIEKMPIEMWQEVIDVNLSGVFYCLQAVGRHMLRRSEQSGGPLKSAAIVNVSSIAGRRGTFGQINYGAAKSGVLGITMSAAREWAKYGIRVNSVAFGLVETPMTETIRGPKFRDQYMKSIPLRRFTSPQEVAQPCCFLLSDAASYITGQHLTIDGGSHIGF